MFDLTSIITIGGYAGIFAIIFAESGLLLGFFLPGDSLLFTAGFLASQGYFSIWLLAPLLFVAAVTGDSAGYWFGSKMGPKIFTRDDSLFFSQENVRRAREFFERHGRKTIILARFMPVIRSFAPVLAGVGKMNYRTFFLFNVIGGALWSIGLTLLGYVLGSVVPNVDRYLLPIIALIVLTSVLPSAVHVVKDPKMRGKIVEFIKNPRIKR